MGAFVLVTISANPVERVKRAYDYTPPEGDDAGLFPVGENDITDEGNLPSPSDLSNAFEFDKPAYTPNCCAHCTCS